LRGSQRKTIDIFLWSKAHEKLEKWAGNGNMQSAMNPALGTEQAEVLQSTRSNRITRSAILVKPGHTTKRRTAVVVMQQLLFHWKRAIADSNYSFRTIEYFNEKGKSTKDRMKLTFRQNID